jgi:PAS domain S-box-containing protein
MSTKGKTKKELVEELETLKEKLNEAQAKLGAIRSGETDAPVVRGRTGEQVFALTGAEHVYRELVETMKEGAAALSPDGSILYCNGRLAEMLRMPVEKIVGKSMSGFVHPDDRNVFDALVEQGQRDRSRAEVALMTGDGETLQVLVSARTPRTDERQRVVLVVADLTEPMQNKAALAEGRLSDPILEQAGDPIIVCDERGRVVRASRTARELCSGDPLFQPFDETFHLVDRGRAVPILSLLEGEPPKDREVSWKRGGAEPSTFLLNARKLSDSEGKLLGCVLTLADITDRKKTEEALHRAHGELETLVQERTAELWMTREMLRKEVEERRSAEKALKESRRFIQQIADATPNMIFLYDMKEKKLIYVNGQVTKCLGFTPEECCALGSRVLERIHPEDAEIAAEYLRTLSVAEDGEIHSGEHRIKKKNGRWMWLRTRGLVFSRDENGAPSVHLGAGEDITAEKEGEKALAARAKQQAALSQLSARALAGGEISMLMDEAAETISRALDVKYAGIMELRPDGKSLLLRAGAGWKKDRVGRATLATGTGSLAGYTLDCGGPVAIEEMSGEKRFTPSPLVIEHGIVSGLCTVFAGKEQPFGILAVYTKEKRVFAEDEIRFLQAAANVLAQAVERDRTQRALEESEAKFRTLAEKIPAVLYIDSLHEDSATLYVSPQIENLLGHPREEFTAAPLSWVDKIHPEDRAGVLDKLARSRAGGGTFTAEYRMLARDGRVVWVRDEASPVHDEKGRPLFLQGLLFDITESRHAKETLQRTTELLERVFSNIHVCVAYMDRDFNFVRVNRAYADADEKTPEELAGKNHFSLYPHKENEEIFRKVRDTGEPYFAYEKPFAYRANPERGLTYWDWSLQPIKEAEGGVSGLVLSLVNVTERKRAEEESLRLTTAIEQAHEGVVVTDRDGAILYANPAFERISGLQRAEILGGKLDEVGSTEGYEKFYVRETVWSGHVRRKREDGTVTELETTISPVRDPGEAVVNYVVVERDVTEEMKLEQHLRQLQKMDAIGALAGGIAHDFNNILQPIIINSELINYEAEEGSLEKQYISHVLTAANRGKELVKQILMFSRTTGPEQKPMLVAPIVKEVLKFLRATLPRTVEIRRKVRSENATVTADPTSVHQVLMNLCSNASHAMREKGGVLEVCLEDVEIEPGTPARPVVHPDLKPGPYVRLTVADTGCGMDSATMQRIFDPFFTTKKPGEGTGMGLSVVHGIVKKLKGSILVSSEPGKGTTFHIFLPRVPAELAGEDTAEPPVPAGKEKILLVDDEVAIVQSEQTMLERLGYRVVGKTDGLEALEILQARPDAFDMVITDQTMHPITGMDLAQKILDIRPDLPVILCTGYSEALHEETVKSAGIRELIMKPLTSRDIAEIVRRVLDDRAKKTHRVNEE